jgi:hypothetical protein
MSHCAGLGRLGSERFDALHQETDMTPRLDNPSALFPAGFKAMVALEQALAHPPRGATMRADAA